jgi:protein TonB
MPTRIRVGGLVQMAKLQNKVEPLYPQAAREAGITGTVEMQVLISKEGTVESATIIDGNPLLAAAAQQAVLQWVYGPTRLNGDPVEVQTTVSIPFN